MNFILEKYFSLIQVKRPNDLGVKLLYWHLKDHGSFSFGDFVDLVDKSQKGKYNPLSIPTVSEIERSYKKQDDYRIRYMTIKNFKKYGTCHKNMPYGLNLQDADKKPMSLLIVGHNGTGKTSLFSALEYILTPNHISAMVGRSIEDNKRKDFLSHATKRINDIAIKLYTVGESKYISSRDSRMPLRPFFCSEYDIDALSREKDYTTFIKDELGLTEIESLINDLRENIKILDEQKLDISFKESPSYWDLGTLQSDIMYIASLNSKRYEECYGNFVLIKHCIDNTNVTKATFIQDIFTAMKLLSSYILTPNKTLKLPLAVFNENLEFLKSIAKMVDKEELTPDMVPRISDIQSDFVTFIEEMKIYLYRLGTSILTESKVANKSQLQKAVDQINQINLEKQDRNIHNIKYWEAESKLIKNANEVKGILSLLLTDILNKYEEDYNIVCNDIKSFIPTVVNEFAPIDKGNDKNRDVLQVKIENGIINMFVQNEFILGSGNCQSPQFYYNSFRFKMFCLTLKMALALQTMRLLNINAPFVLDDVFMASDFDNSIHSDCFWQGLFESFRNATKKKLSELQIVFFTHDEVVLNSVARCFRMYGGRELKYKAARLYDPQMLDEQDYVQEGKYYNLYQAIG